MIEFLSQDFYGNTIEQWAISIGIFVASIVVAKICYILIGKYVKKITAKTKSQLDDILVHNLEKPAMFGVGLVGFYWGFERLKFGDSIDAFFANLLIVLITINVTWFLVRIVDSLIEEYIMPLVVKSESDFDDQLMPLLRKVVKVSIWSLGIVISLNNAGFDVAALIAGLGIGGLALALAAQDSVKNIFGGVMIYLDKPFKIGDRIKMIGFDGVVEEVGLRSSRIRTLEGRLVTIPNAQFNDNAVENVTREPTRKVVNNLGLTYDTTPERMELAISILNELVDKNDDVEENRITSFNTWGDFSLGILFIYYIKPEADILEVQSQMNLELLKRFNAEGLEFAFPTQTIYTKKEG